MGFNNTDKSFTIKISSLFIVLAVGIIINKTQPTLRNNNQDVIKVENNKPSINQTVSVKQVNTPQLYNNSFR